MTSPVTDRRVPPLGSLGPSPSKPLGGIPPGPGRRKSLIEPHKYTKHNLFLFTDKQTSHNTVNGCKKAFEGRSQETTGVVKHNNVQSEQTRRQEA